MQSTLSYRIPLYTTSNDYNNKILSLNNTFVAHRKEYNLLLNMFLTKQFKLTSVFIAI